MYERNYEIKEKYSEDIFNQLINLKPDELTVDVMSMIENLGFISL